MTTETLTLNVPDMTCDHCVQAVTTGVSPIDGVAGVDVDLATKRVVVTGRDLDRDSIVAAIDDAGFDVAPDVD
ncbi:MAG: heavy-metal-associated domain-containing protein [Ilumatobacteraceae bacterium]